jgi:hypothetical protein
MKHTPVATPDHPLIQSGLISVHLEVVAGGISLHGPLSFDGNVVAKTGMWSYGIDPDDDDAVSDAIADAYRSEFDGWCQRKEAERAANAPSIKRRVKHTGSHTPCPTLWAGR